MIKDYWINDNLIITRYVGLITGRDLTEASLLKSGDERFDTIHYIVGDWLESETPELSAKHVKELVACLRPISSICPNALAGTIVRPDKHGNALAQYYKSLCEQLLSWEVEVFHSYEDCFAWFGITQTLPFKVNSAKTVNKQL